MTIQDSLKWSLNYIDKIKNIRTLFSIAFGLFAGFKNEDQ